MDYLTTTRELTDRIPSLDARDPLIRAALDLATQPWLAGIHSGADALLWGEFATSVQSVADRLWPSPVTLRISAPAPAAGPALNHATAELTRTVADRFARAATDPTEPDAWTFAQAAAELRTATEDLP